MDARVWADVERLLREPAALLAELGADHTEQASDAARRTALLAQLEDLMAQQERAVALHIRGMVAAGQLEAELARIARERASIEDELNCAGPLAGALVQGAALLLATARERLATGLTDEERRELIALLVRGVVRPDGPGSRAAVEFTYRLPEGTGADQDAAVARRTVRLPLPRRQRATPAGDAA
jgi:hypothetical protein